MNFNFMLKVKTAGWCLLSWSLIDTTLTNRMEDVIKATWGVREPDIDNIDIMELDTHNFVITEPDTKNANAMQLYVDTWVVGIRGYFSRGFPL